MATPAQYSFRVDTMHARPLPGQNAEDIVEESPKTNAQPLSVTQTLLHRHGGKVATGDFEFNVARARLKPPRTEPLPDSRLVFGVPNIKKKEDKKKEDKKDLVDSKKPSAGKEPKTHLYAGGHGYRSSARAAGAAIMAVPPKSELEPKMVSRPVTATESRPGTADVLKSAGLELTRPKATPAGTSREPIHLIKV